MAYNPPIGSIYYLYTTYILPSGGLYATYHLLGEPETTIDNHINLSCVSVYLSHPTTHEKNMCRTGTHTSLNVHITCISCTVIYTYIIYIYAIHYRVSRDIPQNILLTLGFLSTSWFISSSQVNLEDVAGQ